MCSVDMVSSIIDYNESISNIEKSLIIKEGKAIIHEDYKIFNESLKDGLKKIAEAIKALVTKFFNWLKSMKDKVMQLIKRGKNSKSSNNDNEKTGEYPDYHKIILNIGESINNYLKTQGDCVKIVNILMKGASATSDTEQEKIATEIGKISEGIKDSKDLINNKIEEVSKLFVEKSKSYSNSELEDCKEQSIKLIERINFVLNNNTREDIKQVYTMAEKIAEQATNSGDGGDNDTDEHKKILYNIQNALAGIASYMTTTGTKLFSQCSTLSLRLTPKENSESSETDTKKDNTPEADTKTTGMTVGK